MDFLVDYARFIYLIVQDVQPEIGATPNIAGITSSGKSIYCCVFVVRVFMMLFQTSKLSVHGNNRINHSFSFCVWNLYMIISTAIIAITNNSDIKNNNNRNTNCGFVRASQPAKKGERARYILAYITSKTDLMISIEPPGFSSMGHHVQDFT